MSNENVFVIFLGLLKVMENADNNARRVAKSFVKYDRYLDDTNNETLRDDSKPLPEYLRMRKMAATPPCDSIREGRLLLPGQWLVSAPQRVSTEYGKTFTRSMLKALWENEQNDECFSDYDQSHMWASRSGRARFKGLRRMQRTGHQAKSNYDSAHNILTALYTRGDEAIPEDINHLLELIKNYPLKKDLYHIHASLVPLSKRQPSYIKMFEQLMYKMSPESRDQIPLNLPYSELWKEILKGNRLLERIYDFKPSIYAVPDSPEQQNQPTFEEQLERSRKRKREESSKMTKYHRHRTAHRMDDVVKEVELGQGGYQAEDSELVALVILNLEEPLFALAEDSLLRSPTFASIKTYEC
ncbi:hypothetical protein EJB05_47676, partial [Eragrostis curvula]